MIIGCRWTCECEGKEHCVSWENSKKKSNSIFWRCCQDSSRVISDASKYSDRIRAFRSQGSSIIILSGRHMPLAMDLVLTNYQQIEPSWNAYQDPVASGDHRTAEWNSQNQVSSALSISVSITLGRFERRTGRTPWNSYKPVLRASQKLKSLVSMWHVLQIYIFYTILTQRHNSTKLCKQPYQSWCSYPTDELTCLHCAADPDHHVIDSKTLVRHRLISTADAWTMHDS